MRFTAFSTAEGYTRTTCATCCSTIAFGPVLRVGAGQRNLLLYALHVHLDGGEPVALEVAGLCRPDRARPVRHAGADAAADAVANAALHALPGEPPARPAGPRSLPGRR